MFSVLQAFSFTHPNMYINGDELASVKAKVQANASPWTGANSRMMSDANSALNGGSYSVVDGGPVANGDPHLYYTQLPENPGADRTDYSAAIKLGDAVRSLGQAYYFTGQSKYADKAISLINKWCLDPQTYMEPIFYNRQSLIEVFITLPGMFWGADFIWNYSGWNTSDKQAFQDWCSDFIQEAKTTRFQDSIQKDGNLNQLKNFEDWRLNFIASAAVIAEEQSGLDYAFSYWKRNLPYRITTTGFMKNEIGRTKGLDYSMYAINALVQTCEIARHYGVDLYSYTSGSVGIELALDNHVQYMLNPSSWPYHQEGGYKGANVAIYELAHLYKQKSTYMQVINKYGRPMNETRTLGWVTLTHCYGAYLWAIIPTAPTVALPVISPNGGAYELSVEVSISTSTSGATLYYTTDGSDPDSTSTVYSGPFTLTSGATVKARGYKSGMHRSSIASASFTITGPDLTPPAISSVAASGDPTAAVVVFSEPVETSSAENAANYGIDNGISISSASLNPDNKSVTLTTSPMTKDVTYTLTVNNVRDRATTPNTIAANSRKTFAFLAWTCADVGGPAPAGSCDIIDGTSFDVTGGGTDIWNEADEFHFCYLPLAGDFDVVVRLASVEQQDAWSKAGLMARESLDPGSRQVHHA
jgi:hypothetical protein